jgi:hypothetical protein
LEREALKGYNKATGLEREAAEAWNAAATFSKREAAKA